MFEIVTDDKEIHLSPQRCRTTIAQQIDKIDSYHNYDLIGHNNSIKVNRSTMTPLSGNFYFRFSIYIKERSPLHKDVGKKLTTNVITLREAERLYKVHNIRC